MQIGERLELFWTSSNIGWAVSLYPAVKWDEECSPYKIGGCVNHDAGLSGAA